MVKAREIPLPPRAKEVALALRAQAAAAEQRFSQHMAAILSTLDFTPDPKKETVVDFDKWVIRET